MNSTYDVVFNGTRAMRIAAAKQYLQENSIEIMKCAASIFKLTFSTLHSFIKHDKDVEFEVLSSSQYDEQNKVLQKHEIDALHEFIKSLLSYDISSTHELVFSAISTLKLIERDDASSRR
jgi:hypothetical protein